MGLKRSLSLDRWLGLLDATCLLALDCTFSLSFFALLVIPQRLSFCYILRVSIYYCWSRPRDSKSIFSTLNFDVEHM